MLSVASGLVLVAVVPGIECIAKVLCCDSANTITVHLKTHRKYNERSFSANLKVKLLRAIGVAS